MVYIRAFCVYTSVHVSDRQSGQQRKLVLKDVLTLFTLLWVGVKERHLLRLWIINKDNSTEAVSTVGHHIKKKQLKLGVLGGIALCRLCLPHKHEDLTMDC